MPLEIFSHNVYGFEQNKDVIRDTCSTIAECIHALQETWLRPPYKR